ncbi:hypothetical protein ABD86_03345 [Paenibacillus alvei]|nr:hypothetical protein [Paenibacillus alvei]MBG9743007.1 hypothetical protein [Paenibacillus alvei]
MAIIFKMISGFKKVELGEPFVPELDLLLINYCPPANYNYFIFSYSSMYVIIIVFSGLFPGKALFLI